MEVIESAAREKALNLPKKIPGISRRNFLKGAGVAIGVAAIGGANQSLDRVGNPTFNSVALYENHITSIDADKIPLDTDIFFKEAVPTEGNYYKMPPEEVMYRVLGRESAEKLSTQNTELMVADVGEYKDRFLIGAGIPLAEAVIGIGALDVGLRLGSGEKKKALSTRRKFLRNLARTFALGTAAFTLSPLVSEALSVPATLQENEAIKRLVARFNSLVSDLHPEQVLVFLRNLVLADKFLQVGKDFQENHGRKAKIVLNIGAAHGGIEDFLRAGQDVCRELIMAYPDFVLKYFVESAGGIENFCTARLLKITTPKMAVAAPTTYGQTKDTYISDRRVLDNVLVGKLKSRLA